MSVVGVSQVKIIESLEQASISSVKASVDLFKLAKVIFTVFKEGLLSLLFMFTVGGSVRLVFLFIAGGGTGSVSDIVPLGGWRVLGDNDVPFGGDGVCYRAGEVVAAAWDGVRTVSPCDVGGEVGFAVTGVALGFVQGYPF